MPDPVPAQLQRILGIDFGTARVGVAVSDPLGIIAQGVTTLRNDQDLMAGLSAIIAQYEPSIIVVGVPLTLRGREGASADAAGRFAALLKTTFGLPVERADERFSSATAHRTLRDMGVRKQRRQDKAVIDAMAAAVILQGYLDSRRYNRNSGPGEGGRQ